MRTSQLLWLIRYALLWVNIWDNQGKMVLILKYLYRMKSAKVYFYNNIADCMKYIGYTPCLEDPDLWMNPMVMPFDGTPYYTYLFCYVDDIHRISHDLLSVLQRLEK